jgi:hypothetical protein
MLEILHVAAVWTRIDAHRLQSMSGQRPPAAFRPATQQEEPQPLKPNGRLPMLFEPVTANRTKHGRVLSLISPSGFWKRLD